MLITILKDKMGCVHIFKGAHSDSDFRHTGYRITLNDMEADLYMQYESDIQSIEFFLNKDQTTSIDAGYSVVIEDPGYFGYQE